MLKRNKFLRIGKLKMQWGIMKSKNQIKFDIPYENSYTLNVSDQVVTSAITLNGFNYKNLNNEDGNNQWFAIGQ